MAEDQREDVYCTLLLNDDYLPGAQVLAHSLRDGGTTKKIVILVTDSVSPGTIAALQLNGLYDQVIQVPTIHGRSTANLIILNRLELNNTFTKINLWKQTQFRKIVYIDADVLAVRPPDELFDLDVPFAASPDIGWPDCFNSGVMLLKPDEGTYHSLMMLAQQGVSFDGADQGLLNIHFRNWHRLSFAYNCTPSSSYQYIPAYRYFESQVSMVHFIGADKPWKKNPPNTHSNSSPYDQLLGRWWAVHHKHFYSGNQPTFQNRGYSGQDLSLDSVRNLPYGTQSNIGLKKLFSDSNQGNQNAPFTSHNYSAPTRVYNAPPLPIRYPGYNPRDIPDNSAQSFDPRGHVFGYAPGSQEDSNLTPRRPLSPHHHTSQYQAGGQTGEHNDDKTTAQHHSLGVNLSAAEEGRQTWDPTRRPPPPDSGPEALNFPQTSYKNEWDGIRPDTSSLYRGTTSSPTVVESETSQMFNIPDKPASSPDSETTPTATRSMTPVQTGPKPVFPWEERRGRPTRVFSSPVTNTNQHGRTPEHTDTELEAHRTSDESSIESEEEPDTEAAYSEGENTEEKMQWRDYIHGNQWDAIPEISKYVSALRKQRAIFKDSSRVDSTTDGPTLRESYSDDDDDEDHPTLPVTPNPLRSRRPFWAGGPKDIEEQFPSAPGIPSPERWDPHAKLDELRTIPNSFLARQGRGGNGVQQQ